MNYKERAGESAGEFPAILRTNQRSFRFPPTRTGSLLACVGITYMNGGHGH